MSKTNIAYIQNPLYLYLYTFPHKIMQNVQEYSILTKLPNNKNKKKKKILKM